MSAGPLNLVGDRAIEQGATFTLPLTYKGGPTRDNLTGRNLTGCTIRMQIRLTSESPSVLLELSTTNGRITLDDPANGRFTLRLTDEETAALTGWQKAVHNIEVAFADGTVKRLLQGRVDLSAEVTR